MKTIATLPGNHPARRLAAGLAALACSSTLAGAQTTVREVWGTANGYEYGASIAPTADLNADGISDFLVGTPGWMTGHGGVSLVSGRYLRYGYQPISLASYDVSHGLPSSMFEAGDCVASIGDIAGDTRPELVIGAPGGGPGWIACINPVSTVPIASVFGEASGDRFGDALAATGDVNLDGYEDVLVGAPLHDGFGTDAGAAYLISGKLLATQTGVATLNKFAALADGGQTGLAVESGVDLNGDTRAELVIASPRNHGFPSGADAGVVRVFNGSSYGQLWIGVGVTGERFGSTLCYVPDLNGDGVKDLAIGAPYSDAAGTNAGRVVVYSGAALAQAATVQIVEWTGSNANSLFGSSIAAVGDVNHDGVGDIAIGAHGYVPLFVGNDNGAVYVYSGATLERMVQMTGPAEAKIGRAVSSALDCNADSVSDFLVSGFNHAGDNTLDGYLAAVSLFPEIPASYCTGKTNSAGCVPSITSTGSASLGSSSAFNVGAVNELNQKNGLLFYGFDNNAAAFQGGTLCVKPPTARSAIQNSGGSALGNDCSGSFSFDFKARIQGGLDPNLVLGQEVFCQYWARDPGSPSTTSLSNALRFLIGP